MGPLTVGSVLAHDATVDEAARAWAKAAWLAWKPWHDQIREWQDVLAVARRGSRGRA
jgi:hypothetical protein